MKRFVFLSLVFALSLIASMQIVSAQVSGTFSVTGSMTQGRHTHTATLLLDAKVLIAGGEGGVPTAELYDPVAGIFSPTGSMADRRQTAAATRLLDGTVLVSGGLDGSTTFLASAEIFDPATGLWSPTDSLSEGRYIHTSTLLEDGTVLITGGLGCPNCFLSSSEIYDPDTGTWTSTGNLGMGRYLLCFQTGESWLRAGTPVRGHLLLRRNCMTLSRARGFPPAP